MISDKLDRLSYRERVFLALALVFVICVAADRLAVQFIVDQFKSQEEQTEKQRSALKRNLRIAAGERLVADDYARIRSRLGQPASRAAAMDDLKGKIDEMARESGIVIVSMKDRDPRSTDAYEEYAIEIGRFESGTKELLAFLHRVRTFPGMMRVSKLAVAPDKDTGQLTGAMLISRIMEKPSSEPQNPAKPKP